MASVTGMMELQEGAGKERDKEEGTKLRGCNLVNSVDKDMKDDKH